MQRVNEVLAEVEALIAVATRAHEQVKVVNSPYRLRKDDREHPQPYLSLQPPPGLDSTTLHLETMAFYFMPDININNVLLFYAGPIHNDASHPSISDDDYIALTVEDHVSLHWRLGGHYNSSESSYSFTDSAEFLVTRVGSMFELQVSDLPEPLVYAGVDNGSLVFRVTENTVYLVGGYPQDLAIAVPDFTRYSSFEGVVSLVLYNGHLWSLWDYSTHSTSNSLDFNRNRKASENAWIPSGLALDPHVLSFDGSGYIKPTKFISVSSMFSGGTIITMTLFRPSLDGLVMFMYDTTNDCSLEVGIADGTVCVAVTMMATDTSMVTSTGCFPLVLPEHRIFILHFGSFIRVFNNTNQFHDLPNIQLNFDEVEVWFGGVELDNLPTGYRPNISNHGYRGCIHMDVVYMGTTYLVFDSNPVKEYYVPSENKQAVSFTCLNGEHVSCTCKPLSVRGTCKPLCKRYLFVCLSCAGTHQHCQLGWKLVFVLR